MATIRQSRAVNMDGWKAKEAPPPDSIPPYPPEDRQRAGRSPFMLSSMPFDASSNPDGLTRQFYGGGNAPTTRIFVPVVD